MTKSGTINVALRADASRFVENLHTAARAAAASIERMAARVAHLERQAARAQARAALAATYIDSPRPSLERLQLRAHARDELTDAILWFRQHAREARRG
ncbi:hypothetical protein [Aeromicrobium sp. Leaf291]|uniref:hypothetical protein n=1 Tax=Aeromicrobium sp. Leaf291 TaxID=1736325 RepID=UPI0006FD1D02|nr:hypothetical protein [Aeromicrobium sp. Leaf291]KQP81627.1 hypothetical protein ASF35_16480 [Aeromicrobium sp. Leaf291]